MFKEKVDTPQELNVLLTNMKNSITSSDENIHEWNKKVEQISYFDENYNEIVNGLLPRIKP